MKIAVLGAGAVLALGGCAAAPAARQDTPAAAASAAPQIEIPSAVRTNWIYYGSRICVLEASGGDADMEICLSQVLAECEAVYRRTGGAQNPCRVP